MLRRHTVVSLVPLVVGAMSVVGCVSFSRGHVAALAAREVAVPSQPASGNFVSGEHCAHVWMFPPIPLNGWYRGSFEKALRDAVAEAPNANALKEVNVTDSFVWFFPSNYTRLCIQVTGDPVNVGNRKLEQQ